MGVIAQQRECLIRSGLVPDQTRAERGQERERADSHAEKGREFMWL